MPTNSPAQDTVSVGDERHWVSTWSASPIEVSYWPVQFDNETLRIIVRTSIAGEQVRVHLSNLFGTRPLAIGVAHVALAAEGTSIEAASDRVLTFSGESKVIIPPNADLVSDPVDLAVPVLTNLAVSLYLPEPCVASTCITGPSLALTSPSGDFSGAVEFLPVTTLSLIPFLTGVDVIAPAQAGAIVAFGDSLTVGPWPDFLAERLLASSEGSIPLTVLKQAISGNRILHAGRGEVGYRFGPAGISRFERDALSQAGVRYVMVLEGINDLIHPGGVAPASEEVSAEEIIAGLNFYIERAHEKGIKIIGGTLTPFTGYAAGFTPNREEKRLAVNHWIRSSGRFDGIFDADQATRDPHQPDCLLPAYDSGDHLHFNEAGARAIANAIDLSLFQSPS